MTGFTTLKTMPALDQVMSVYSGKDGKCCCGCAGKYSYAKAHQVAAGKNRGYTVGDDEINDKMVKKVHGIIAKAILCGTAVFGDNNISTVVGGPGERLYIVYPLGA